MRWTDRLAQIFVCAGVAMAPFTANAATSSVRRECLDTHKEIYTYTLKNSGCLYDHPLQF